MTADASGEFQWGKRRFWIKGCPFAECPACGAMVRWEGTAMLKHEKWHGALLAREEAP